MPMWTGVFRNCVGCVGCFEKSCRGASGDCILLLRPSVVRTAPSVLGCLASLCRKVRRNSENRGILLKICGTFFKFCGVFLKIRGTFQERLLPNPCVWRDKRRFGVAHAVPFGVFSKVLPNTRVFFADGGGNAAEEISPKTPKTKSSGSVFLLFTP